jgi:hypothetical protein
VEPVEAPQVTETEVESLTKLLTADPTAIDPATLEAAELVPTEPLPEGGELPEANPESVVSAVTETITEDNARSSAEEFAAAPRALGDGKKSGLSDLEKAGLLALGALAVGAIIKNTARPLPRPPSRPWAPAKLASCRTPATASSCSSPTAPTGCSRTTTP